MSALILVDIQNDFMPDGALPVPNGNEVIPVANKLMDQFDLVVATQDWHPADHGSFASQHSKEIGDVITLNGLSQIMWPDHCIQGTPGAEFVSGLNVEGINKVFQKGTDVAIDSYSGFFDNGHRKSTGLGDYLKELNITEVHIMGLATDYCVKFTALDARQLGFKTKLILEGVHGVDLQPGDCHGAVLEMQAAGVEIA